MLQFPQLSVGGQYPYSPMTGCSSPCTSSKPHLVPQCLIHGGGVLLFVFPVVFLKQVPWLAGLSVPGAGSEHMEPQFGSEGTAGQLLCSLISHSSG